MGLPDVPGTLTFTARQPGVLAGLRPCLQMAQSLGLRAEPLVQRAKTASPEKFVWIEADYAAKVDMV